MTAIFEYPGAIFGGAGGGGSAGGMTSGVGTAGVGGPVPSPDWTTTTISSPSELVWSAGPSVKPAELTVAGEQKEITEKYLASLLASLARSKDSELRHRAAEMLEKFRMSAPEADENPARQPQPVRRLDEYDW